MVKRKLSAFASTTALILSTIVLFMTSVFSPGKITLAVKENLNQASLTLSTFIALYRHIPRQVHARFGPFTAVLFKIEVLWMLQSQPLRNYGLFEEF
jgi:hypothetical protein